MIDLTTFVSWVRRLVDKAQPSESVMLGGSAVAVGLAAGAGVWAFKELIVLAHHLMFDLLGGMLQPLSPWTVAVVPVVGGLLVGAIAFFLIKSERHHGVTSIMEAVALGGGRLRYWRMPAKAAASALSIGAGASVGPEDPSVQIGASFGSMFGQWLRLSDERVRMLVAAGAAAGISAAFNAPIAGVFFAIEIILGELGGRAFSVVVMAAVLSAVFTQAVSGSQPAFHIPAYAFNSAWELPMYLGLGLIAGPVAAIYVRVVYSLRDFFHWLSTPRWLKPAVAGLAVGLVGIFLPQIFGTGYETIEKLLGGESLPVLLLLALLVAKLVLTPASIGAGFLGGVFAPSLFLGAVLGMAYGEVAQFAFPDLHIVPGAFAMVGMAAVLAGAVHAPLTAILLLFEMTNDYRIILPLMFAVVVSMVVSQWMERESVYTLGLTRAGIRLERGQDVEVLSAISVQEVMQADPPVLHEADGIAFASGKMAEFRRQGMPVLDAAGHLVGVITLQDIDRAELEGRHEATVGDVCTRGVLTAFPDESIGDAMRRMGSRDIGRLPVVERDEPTKVIGILRRTDLVRAYNIALARRAAERHRLQQARLGVITGMEVEEIRVEPESTMAGRPVSQIAWPRNTLVVSIRRGRSVEIPRGDSVVRAGDVLVLARVGQDGALLAARPHDGHGEE
jgi:CIC family chloride channel protein